MNIQNHHFNHPISKIPRKRVRRIKKTTKSYSPRSTLRRNFSFKSIPISQQKLQLNTPLLFHNQQHSSISHLQSSPWISQDSISQHQCIESIMNQFPTLSSIDQLFSLASSESLEPNTDLIYLLRYASICTLFDYPHGNQVLIKEGRQLAMVAQQVLQGPEEKDLAGMQLWEGEVSLRQKRCVFMEKLRNNESKYDSSLGRMSQISKQLAFIYRTYLETRGQVNSLLNALTVKISQKSQHFCTTRYAQLLVNKNIKYSFSSHQFDRLNYFKFREYLQTDRLSDFQTITTLKELSCFLDRRKPKRGRKRFLATACSVCLSDYYEQRNPLRNCIGCGLRAHQLCYSFDGKRCGYCIYQMLERQIKESINWCIICQKPGLMIIKLDGFHYAHAFCLLVHGFWKIKSNYNIPITKSCIKEMNEEYFQNIRENKSKNMRSQICFYIPTTQQPKIESSQERNHIINISFHKQLLQQPNFDIQSEQLGEVIHFPFSKSNKLSKKIQQCNQGIQQHTRLCNQCGDPFFQNCFLTCQTCGKQYHSLCSFLGGFDMRVQERGANKEIKLNCCIEGSQRIGWNRRYKLNYQRCAFTPNPADFAQVIQDDMWMN